MIRGGVVRGAAVRAGTAAVSYTQIAASVSAQAQVTGAVVSFSLYAAFIANSSTTAGLQTGVRFSAASAAAASIQANLVTGVVFFGAISGRAAAAAELTSGIPLRAALGAYVNLPPPVLSAQIKLAAAPKLVFSAAARIRSLASSELFTGQAFVRVRPKEQTVLVMQ